MDTMQLQRARKAKHYLFRQWLLVVSTAALSNGISGCSLFEGSDKEKEASKTALLATDDGRGDHSGTWLDIDTSHETVTVMDGDLPIHVFSNAAFGSSGVGIKRRQGDNITPKGQYHLGWINPYSKFHRFLGLTYPSIADAERGLSSGIISKPTYEQIKSAHERGAVPPQYTALGGQIGIHGNGRGSLNIHRIANWTSGCIALENGQMDVLMRWAKPGMLVDVR
jgi:hypothetical protein